MTSAGEAGMTSQMIPLELMVNGQPWQGEVRAEETLLEFVRERLGLTGTKRSCESEVCGACTVLVDDRPVSACTYLAFETAGRSLLTIEGLERGDVLDPVQRAFVRHEGFQCGFCTPGMILTAKALLLENDHPTPQEIAAYLRGNICRCGAYSMIVSAILAAAEART